MSGAPDRAIAERKVLKAALREKGLSARQADALLRGGYKALIGETAAENAELRDQLEELKRRISQ